MLYILHAFRSATESWSAVWGLIRNRAFVHQRALDDECVHHHNDVPTPWLSDGLCQCAHRRCGAHEWRKRSKRGESINMEYHGRKYNVVLYYMTFALWYDMIGEFISITSRYSSFTACPLLNCYHYISIRSSCTPYHIISCCIIWEHVVSYCHFCMSYDMIWCVLEECSIMVEVTIWLFIHHNISGADTHALGAHSANSNLHSYALVIYI